jgi:hypothetical protein
MAIMKKTNKLVLGHDSGVEHLPGNFEDLSSNPSTAKREKENQQMLVTMCLCCGAGVGGNLYSLL